MGLKLGLECLCMHVSCLLQGKPSDNKKYEEYRNYFSVSQNSEASMQRLFLRKAKYFTGWQQNVCGYIAVSFLGARSWQQPIYKQISYGQAGKTKPKPHLVETGIAPLMPPKLCWFTPPEKDQVDPGESIYMTSKRGDPCLQGVWFVSGISLNSTHM